MNNLQKIIKTIATIFAVFLAVTIIGGIIASIYFALNLDDRSSRNNNSDYYNEDYDEGDSKNMRDYDTHNFDKTYDNITSIKVDNAIDDVYFTSGDKFQVTLEDVSTKCTVSENNGTLEIKDRTRYGADSLFAWIEDFFDGNSGRYFRGGTITIVIPKNALLSNCNIDAGTGSITLDDFAAKKIDLDAGTGSIDGSNFSADFLDLDAGTGSIDFHNVNFGGMDLDAGTGSIAINGRLTGQNDIDCGTGSVYLSLADPQETYRLKLEKGLGGLTIDGSNSSSITNNPAGAQNYLSVEGGVGSITIDFAAQS